MKLIILFGLIAAVTCGESEEIGKLHRVTHIGWFDIKIGGDYVGRIEIGLFGKVEPMIVTKIVELMNKPKGKGYKGSKFYEVRKNDFISGGDWIRNNGKMAERRSNDEIFIDESFKLKHYGAGWLSINGYADEPTSSLFIITLRRTDWFDNKRLVFGKIIDGMNVLRKISKIPVDKKNFPVKDIVISDCGADFADPPFFVDEADAIDE